MARDGIRWIPQIGLGAEADRRGPLYTRAMADQGDQGVLDEIHALMEVEHDLLEHHPHLGREPAIEEQLQELDVEIDRLWDLLRQRRALRRVGADPAGAILRPPGTVEGYQQ